MIERGRQRAFIAGVIGLVAAWGAVGLVALGRTDLLGALAGALLVYCLLRGRVPTLYGGVFLIVAFLEIYGTAVGAWSWAAQMPVTGVPAGNPPSGIASIYVLFDIAAIALAPRLLTGISSIRLRLPALSRPARSARLRDSASESQPCREILRRMSQPNAEVRRASRVSSSGAGTWATSNPRLCYDPDQSSTGADRRPDARTCEGEFRGLEDLSRAMREYLHAFSDLRIEAEEIIDLGRRPRPGAVSAHRGSGKLSGAPHQTTSSEICSRCARARVRALGLLLGSCRGDRKPSALS